MENFAWKDLISIIYRRKWIIVLLTLLSILSSALYSTYGIKPQYQVRATVSMNPIIFKSGINTNSMVMVSEGSKSLNTINAMDNKILGSILSQVNYPAYDVNAIANLLNNAEYRQKVLKNNSFTGSIQVAVDIPQNQLSIVVIDDKADKLVAICKSLLEGLPIEIDSDINSQLKKVEDFVSQGLTKEKNNMYLYNKRIQEFYSSIGGVDKYTQASTEKQIEYPGLANDYILASQAFNSYKLVEKELDIIKSKSTSNLNNLKVVSQDTAPLKASPKILTSVLLAAILGLMLSIFIVYCMEYMKKIKVK